MDWRSILKFDENLYNHTDESTKEKHQRILDFIKDRPKTKRTGLRIKQFLDSGELDESFSAFDLPRNSITPNTNKYYENLGDFREVKSRVNILVNTFSNMFTVYRDKIQSRMDGMPIKDFTSAFSKLVKNFYYTEIPKLNNEFDREKVINSFRNPNRESYEKLSVSNTAAYKKAVVDYLGKFDGPAYELLLDIVYLALKNFLPSTSMSLTSSMNIKTYL